jgi:TolB-like protein/Tfp pilus assembly protein PilF
VNFLHDLRRRRVFRLAGLYIVGAWVVIQVTEQLFQAWGIPETANRFVFIAAALCFPIALIFGWIFDITNEGIVRTKKAGVDDAVPMRLQKADYAILAALAAISVAVMIGSAERIQEEIESGYAAPASIERRANSIAVLPFKNLDIRTETGYFSDGITEEILQRLSMLGALHVLASSSSFSFRNSDRPPAEISRSLGVSFLLDGSIRRDQDNIRVTARLLDNSGYQVWSETFDRQLTEIFAVQSDIARTVSQEIVNEIVPLQALPAGRTTDNMEAYNAYLLGRHALRTRAWEWKRIARNAFEKANELDPGFAPPYAGLAALVLNSDRGPHWDEALKKAEKALQLDPQLAEGHAIKGLIKTVLGDPEAGAAALEHAIELDPSLSTAYEWLGLALSRSGRPEERLAIRNRGLEVDPLNPVLVANMALDESYRGNFDRAEQLYRRIAALPEISGPASGILKFYELWGRYDRMLEITKEFVFKLDNYRESLWALAQAYAHLGMQDEADFWYDKLLSIYPDAEGDASDTFYLFRFYDDRERVLERVRLVQSDTAELSETDPSYLGYGSLAFINAGDYAQGLEWLETSLRVFHEEYEPDTPRDGVDVALFRRHWHDQLVFEVMHYLAFAYQQVARHDEAAAILEQVSRALEEHEPRNPGKLEWFALQSVLESDMDSAFEYLARAVDVGWANYHGVINDPAWARALEDERIAALLDIAKERVRQQRDNVQTLEESEDFKVAIERLLGG